MHGYIAYYRSQQAEIYADSLHQAKVKAIAHFKVRPKQGHMVSVVLAELNVDPETKKGEQVTHLPLM